MNNETTFLDQVDAVPEDSKTVDKKLVEFQRTWVLWENYLQDKKADAENADKDKDWNTQIKKVFSFNDLITFWQFWRAYPGSDPKDIFYDGERYIYFFHTKRRIEGLNLFNEGIQPEWEDPQNSKGRILQLQYEIKSDIDDFLALIKQFWLRLVLLLIGESLPCSKLVRIFLL